MSKSTQQATTLEAFQVEMATRLVETIKEIALTADTIEDQQELAYNAFAYLASDR